MCEVTSHDGQPVAPERGNLSILDIVLITGNLSILDIVLITGNLSFWFVLSCFCWLWSAHNSFVLIVHFLSLSCNLKEFKESFA